MARGVLAAFAVLLALALTGCDPAFVCSQLEIRLGAPGCGEATLLNSPPVIERVEPFVPAPEVGSSVHFSAQASDPDGDQLYYEWDLNGDGTYEHGGYTPFASRTYSRAGVIDVRLRVSDFPNLPGGEGQAIATKRMRVHTEEQLALDRPPVASFRIDPNPVRAGEPLTLDASSSTDPDGDPLAYSWSGERDGPFFIGDTQSPTFTASFALPWSGDIVLDVVDDYGRLARATMPVTVTDAPPPRPDATLAIDPNPARLHQTVTFSAEGLSQYARDVDHYEWDLDGMPGYELRTRGSVTQRSYSTRGDVSVYVIVVDTRGRERARLMGTLHVTGPSTPSEGPNARAVAARGVKLGAPRPFSARLGGRGTLRASLNGPPKLTSAERALERFLSASWRTRLHTSVDKAAGTATVGVVALAVPARGGDSACVRLTVKARAGAIPRGTFEVIGGTGAAARLRGRGTFRFRAVGKRPALVVGTVRAGRGRAQPLPRACALKG